MQHIPPVAYAPGSPDFLLQRRIDLMTRLLFLGLVASIALSAGSPVLAQKKDPPKVKEQPKDPPKAKEPPKEFASSIGMKFVWIPAGSFTMGSPGGEKER